MRRLYWFSTRRDAHRTKFARATAECRSWHSWTEPMDGGGVTSWVLSPKCIELRSMVFSRCCHGHGTSIWNETNKKESRGRSSKGRLLLHFTAKLAHLTWILKLLFTAAHLRGTLTLILTQIITQQPRAVPCDDHVLPAGFSRQHGRSPWPAASNGCTKMHQNL